MSIINTKPEMMGFAVYDFYALIVLEGLLFIFCMLVIAPYNFTLSAVTFVVIGAPTYIFFVFKKLLPRRFFINLIKYFIEPKVYITGADINYKNKLLRAVAEKEDK